MSLPLAGLRVLDLSRLLPGPYATLVLADLGAQVDKVESPEGDPARDMPPQVGDTGAVFYALNRNKRSVVLDLKRPEGAGALLKLVRRYDVLVESFRPGTMERFGLSYERLRQENRGLVYCALSGFGQTGPDRLKAGHDLTYVARSGVLGQSGPREGPPPMPGGQMADIGGSLFALAGILAGLVERARTGEGRLVDISLMDSATAFLALGLGGRLALGGAGRPLERGGELLNGALPSYSVYRTADGRALAVGALEPKFFAALAERLGHPEWVGPAYGAPEERRSVRSALSALFSTRPLGEWVELLSGLDACVEPVAEGDDVLHDAQAAARGLFFQLEDEGRGLSAGQLKTPLAPVELPRRPPPGLGEHTRVVLEEAGLSPDELSVLAPEEPRGL